MRIFGFVLNLSCEGFKKKYSLIVWYWDYCIVEAAVYDTSVNYIMD